MNHSPPAYYRQPPSTNDVSKVSYYYFLLLWVLYISFVLWTESVSTLTSIKLFTMFWKLYWMLRHCKTDMIGWDEMRCYGIECEILEKLIYYIIVLYSIQSESPSRKRRRTEVGPVSPGHNRPPSAGPSRRAGRITNRSNSYRRHFAEQHSYPYNNIPVRKRQSVTFY